MWLYVSPGHGQGRGFSLSDSASRMRRAHEGGETHIHPGNGFNEATLCHARWIVTNSHTLASPYYLTYYHVLQSLLPPLFSSLACQLRHSSCCCWPPNRTLCPIVNVSLCVCCTWFLFSSLGGKKKMKKPGSFLPDTLEPGIDCPPFWFCCLYSLIVCTHWKGHWVKKKKKWLLCHSWNRLVF